jgi:hypothetical protein
MAQPQHTHSLVHLEEALTVLFCLIDDAYALLNPDGARRYESIKRLSDSEIVTLALVQQLRGVESERSFLRDAERFFSHLFPGVAGLHPSSFNRRVRKLRCYLEPLRREILPELVGEPETLLVDSTLCWKFCIRARFLSRRALGKPFGGRCMGKVGFLLSLWGEAASALRNQPHPPLL